VYTLLSPRQKVTPTPYALQTRGIFVDNAGDVGIGTTGPNYKLDVNGNVNATAYYGDGSHLTGVTSAGFGAWVDKTSNYGAQQAATDGFVVVMGNGNNSMALSIYTDNNPNPTTERQGGGSWSNSGGAGQLNFCCPVRKNDYWKVVVPNQPNGDFKVWWIPLGN
ncbi:MAG: hypothetical protein WBL85_06270, partial [Sedimentisphaerales bacterium]